MKYLVIFPLVLLFWHVATVPVVAKLLINEFSSSSGDDWIEIYNDSQDAVLLSDFRIRDGSATNKLDLEGIISPYTVLAVDWQNRLNKSGDTIKIVAVKNESAVEDQISYGEGLIPAPADNQSSGRKTNGSGEWALFASSTKGSSNDAVSPIQPTTPPTLTPTPFRTPTAVKEPTSTKVPTATKAPTPTKIPTQIQSSTSFPKSTTLLTGSEKTVATGVLSASSGARPTAILAAEKEQKDQEAVIVESVSSDASYKGIIYMLPILGGVGSLIFCGILLYLHYRKTRND